MNDDEKSEEIEKKLNWLKDVMEKTGLKATPLAQAGGISPSTLTRFIKAPNVSRIPRDATLDAMALRLKLPLYTGLNYQETQGFSEEGATPLTPDYVASDSNLSQFIDVSCKSDNEVSLKNYWIMQGKALENAGILDGDILEVDYHAEPQIKDIVCISLRDEENFSGKTVFRMLATQHPVPAAIMATNEKDVPSDQLVTFIDGVNARVYGVVSKTFRIYRRK